VPTKTQEPIEIMSNDNHPIFDRRHVERMTRVKAFAPPDPGWRYRHEVALRLNAFIAQVAFRTPDMPPRLPIEMR
jgi:hypothetical protein